MKVSVPKESASGERRVALVPEVVQRLSGEGIEVVIESGAGEAAHHPDAAYEQAGASLGGGWSGAVVAKVAPPSEDEIGRLERGQVLIGFLQPLTSPETVRALADAGVAAFAMEAIPRITRAQSMDALGHVAKIRIDEPSPDLAAVGSHAAWVDVRGAVDAIRAVPGLTMLI
ncbi:MAG TPA: hypothetical protein VHG69_12815, partial [Thermoleophilaceae bacterium]|nr:hypothetical protein [Thermoleophilaceae bacterium]